MFNSLLEGLLVIFLWVGIWSLTEILIDTISNDNMTIKIILYGILTGISLALLWIFVYSKGEDVIM